MNIVKTIAVNSLQTNDTNKQKRKHSDHMNLKTEFQKRRRKQPKGAKMMIKWQNIPFNDGLLKRVLFKLLFFFLIKNTRYAFKFNTSDLCSRNVRFLPMRKSIHRFLNLLS